MNKAKVTAESNLNSGANLQRLLCQRGTTRIDQLELTKTVEVSFIPCRFGSWYW
jgi:hypothetical protein